MKNERASGAFYPPPENEAPPEISDEELSALCVSEETLLALHAAPQQDMCAGKAPAPQERCAPRPLPGTAPPAADHAAGTEAAADPEIMALLEAEARKLALDAMGGNLTKTQYAARRARLLGQARGAEVPLLEAALAALEGDENSPYGGACFQSEGAALCVEVGPRGTRKLSPLLLAQTVQLQEHIVNFRLDAGEFLRYYYAGGVYRPCPDDRLRERVQTTLLKTDESLYRYAAVVEAANAIAHMPPVGDLTLLNADENVVNFKNGLLRLDTMELTFHTPKYYSTVQLDACWTTEDAPTPAFDRLLAGLTGGDKEKERLLLAFMGLCLTNVPGWKLKKALFLYGPGNTGKSVLRNFIEEILGEGNYANVDLQTLEEDKFAGAQLQGKRLAGTSDMGFLKVRQLALFKQLTGGDNVYAQQKGQKPFSFRYRGFLWFCMNEPPMFGGDKGDWVYERILLFPCGASVPESARDPRLPEKLQTERDAVVRRLILAAKTVIDNGCRLDVPPALEESKQAYRLENDPAEKFFMTCCRLRPTTEISPLDECTCKNVFAVFKNWCADNAPGYVPKKSDFRKTCAALLALPEEEIVVRTNKNRYFTFTVDAETIGEYGEQIFLKRQ